MIPKPYIAKWQEYAPWKTFAQVEQDLVISRALVSIFSNDFLQENLAFRGGTALHKLYLNPAPRYSEDIDLVQIKEGPIKPILQKIDEVIDFFEEKRVVKPKKNNNTILYRFTSEHDNTIRLRLKLEINCREHFNVLDLVMFPFELQSEWYFQSTNITCYNLNELLGTKLRALYQRKKGRDLFDLYYAYQNAVLDYNEIIHCYKEYMNFVVNKPPTKKQFLENIEDKQNDSDFTGDMEALLRAGIKYNQDDAFEWIKSDLIDKLK